MTDTDRHITISRAYRLLKEALEPQLGEEAALTARLLLGFALGISEKELYSRANEIFPEQYYARLEDAARRRLSGEPVQYILGEWEFMGLPFVVRAGALIPRQDTEALAEHALELIKTKGYRTALDMCCGTGCIGVALLKLGNVDVTLADISADCIALAKENAVRNGVAAKFVETDMFGGVDGKFDIIASNPPYLTKDDMDALQNEVRFEPESALFGGEDGLDFYRRIAREYRPHLNDGGALLMEVGMGQAAEVMEIFGGGYALKDLCGVERVVVIGQK